MTNAADIDFTHPDLDAVIRWMAGDAYCYLRAIERHQPGPNGRCVLHNETWPCLMHHLADRARALDESRRTVVLEAYGVIWDTVSTVETQPIRIQPRRTADVEATHPLRTVHPERRPLEI